MAELHSEDHVNETTLEYASRHSRRTSPGPSDAGFVEVFAWLFRIAVLLPFLGGAIWIVVRLCVG